MQADASHCRACGGTVTKAKKPDATPIKVQRLLKKKDQLEKELSAVLTELASLGHPV